MTQVLYAHKNNKKKIMASISPNLVVRKKIVGHSNVISSVMEQAFLL
jgi:hypothetical protein